MSVPDVNDRPEERGEAERFAAFQTDNGDLVIYDVAPGRTTEPSGAWIRVRPGDCADLSEFR